MGQEKRDKNTVNEIMKPIRERRAFRGFSQEKVSEEMLIRILEAARLAPSCMNKQPWRFLVLSEPEALEKGQKALSGGNYWAAHAPILIYAITKRDLDCAPKDGRAYAEFDTGLAVQNLLLQAVSEGLIAHPMAGFSPETLREAFAIPEEYTVLTAIALGHPGDGSYLNDKHRELESAPQTRKPYEEHIFMNAWKF